MTAAHGQLDRHIVANPANAVPDGVNIQTRQPLQLALRSAAFITNPIQTGARTANTLGRNILSAGDRLKDMIVPDALAAVISAPAWMPSVGIGGGKKNGVTKTGGPKAEKLRAELDELLASNCPLCESVVAGLDKPFVKEGEVDTSWAL
jgi:hypothetical protein